MVPTNFENNIKEKLEARRLEPSSDSWKKLEQKLAVESKGFNANKNWKLGLVAASIVGLICVSTFVFLDGSNSVVKPTVVDTQIIESLENTNNGVEIESRTKEGVTQPEETNVQVSQKKEEQPLSKSTKDIKQDELLTNVKQQANEVVVNDEKDNSRTSIKEASIIASFETQQINETDTKTLPEQESTTTVTDAEIDALLMTAQKEILSQNLNDQSTTKAVDGNSLLQDIENELDISLRERVLKALTSGYKNVKTAVVERNN